MLSTPPHAELWAALQKMDRDGVNQLPVTRNAEECRSEALMYAICPLSFHVPSDIMQAVRKEKGVG